MRNRIILLLLALMPLTLVAQSYTVYSVVGTARWHNGKTMVPLKARKVLSDNTKLQIGEESAVTVIDEKNAKMYSFTSPGTNTVADLIKNLKGKSKNLSKQYLSYVVKQLFSDDSEKMSHPNTYMQATATAYRSSSNDSLLLNQLGNLLSVDSSSADKTVEALLIDSSAPISTDYDVQFELIDCTTGLPLEDHIAPNTSCYLRVTNRTPELLYMNLLDIDSNISIYIHMQTIEPIEAIKLLKRALSDVQKTKIDEQKKAVRAGYDMDILPTDIVLYEKNTMELLDDLNTSNQKLIWTTILISGFGRNKKELESVTQRISGIIQQANCRLIDLQYKQEVAMNAAAPIGINDTKEGRHLITKNLAILVPFNTQELFQQGQSLYYGLNALSNNMIMADRKKLRTPNGVILGTPGSGKSFSAKREILGSFLVSRDGILICDPEGVYYPLVKALGGEVVKLATNSKDYLNPMDIQLSHKNDREALKLKSDFLITLCDAIAGGENGLANDEKGIIDRCIEKIYDEYFKDPRPENMPLLEDLYNALIQYEPDKAVSEQLAVDARQKAVRIANSLVLYVHGSQNYFNHRTNVDSQNRIVCFDIRDLGKQLKELGMLIVQDAVWNRVSRNRERHVATRYYCDEFHLLLRDKQTAQYSVEIWKRFRKWGGIPTGLTQNVGDFLRSEEIEGILGNSDFVYLLNQNAKDQVILADKLGLSAKQLQYVTNSESGCGLILFNDVVIPFVDRYPTDTKTYKIMNTKPEEVDEPAGAAKQGDDADGKETE